MFSAIPHQETIPYRSTFMFVSSMYSETSLEDHPYSKTVVLKDHVCVAQIAF
jgi:hypothetical protein